MRSLLQHIFAKKNDIAKTKLRNSFLMFRSLKGHVTQRAPNCSIFCQFLIVFITCYKKHLLSDKIKKNVILQVKVVTESYSTNNNIRQARP